MTSPTDTCINCGAALGGQYCASCGQKVPDRDPTLREFLKETTQDLTHWDGRVPRTLRTLFREPGLLTLDFLAGRRTRWLQPLRVYLICSIAYFLSGPLVEAVTHRSERDVEGITVRDSDGRTTLTPEAREEVAQGLAGRILGVERFERALADPARLGRITASAYPKAMFVLLPLFAFLTWTAWRRTLPRYPAHLYFALHLHAACFGVFALEELTGLVPVNEAVQLTVGLGTLAYLTWWGLVAVRRVFRDSWVKTVVKVAAVAVVYAACLFVVSLGMLAYVLAVI